MKTVLVSEAKKMEINNLINNLFKFNNEKDYYDNYDKENINKFYKKFLNICDEIREIDIYDDDNKCIEAIESRNNQININNKLEDLYKEILEYFKKHYKEEYNNHIEFFKFIEEEKEKSEEDQQKENDEYFYELLKNNKK